MLKINWQTFWADVILEPLQTSASLELHSDSLMHLSNKTTDKKFSFHLKGYFHDFKQYNKCLNWL